MVASFHLNDAFNYLGENIFFVFRYQGGEIVSSAYKNTTIKSIFKKKSVWAIIMILALFLSGTVALLTYYGQQVGSFVVGVSDKGYQGGLVLSKTQDFSTSSPRLVGDSVSNVHPISVLDIYSEKVLQNDGSYIPKSKNYMGFTFYLKNEGNISINVDVSMTITKATNYVDRATWIWLFEGEEDKNGTIYRKKDSIAHEYPAGYNDNNYKEYEGDELVMRSTIVYFKPQEIKKYSIIIWLEGEDPDCVDTGEYSVKSGKIRFTMKFDVAGEDEADQSKEGEI